jgi:hypothetical protein
MWWVQQQTEALTNIPPKKTRPDVSDTGMSPQSLCMVVCGRSFWVRFRASGRKLYVWVCPWHVGWGCACYELSAPCWSRAPLLWALCLDSLWGSLTVHILHSNTQQCLRGHRAQPGRFGPLMCHWRWRCSSWGMVCSMCSHDKKWVPSSPAPSLGVGRNRPRSINFCCREFRDSIG